MLFYEPLFLTIFPALYAFYLLLTGASAKKWTLLIASTLFYIHLGRARFRNPARTRKLALAAGIVANLGLLIFYKYADFLAANINLILSPFSASRIPLLHIALPIGVSFVVFEKITYLVDTYRGVSKPADRFSDYCLFVLFFPKLLAGPILKYHEMRDAIAYPPPVVWTDFQEGFLRFARGLGRKL
ncbi:hypothetical protein SYNPS1DRAFT_20403, partial [Syncephalis pseudoplumigaleata]